MHVADTPESEGTERDTIAFWNGKRVFVTGHTGFKGSWLCLWLQRLGAHVHGFALAPHTTPSLYVVADVERNMASHVGDIRTFQRLCDAMQLARPEIVIHLAAQPLVTRSYREPLETFDTNVMGTIHVLEAVRRVGGVRAVLCVTSDKCYGERADGHPFREGDPMGGFDPYSASKGCSELAIASYRRSFFSTEQTGKPFVALASARAGNVIGGGDWSEDRLVADMVKAFAAGRPAAIRNPSAVRPWQHVLDPLAGYVRLAERLWTHGARFAEAWNFGPDPQNATSVGWIADELARRWGGQSAWRASMSARPHEAASLVLDSSKARRRLGWEPKLSTLDAVGWTVDWYLGVHRGDDPRALTLAQIAAYERIDTKDTVP